MVKKRADRNYFSLLWTVPLLLIYAVASTLAILIYNLLPNEHDLPESPEKLQPKADDRTDG